VYALTASAYALAVVYFSMFSKNSLNSQNLIDFSLINYSQVFIFFQGAAGNIDIREKIKVLIPIRCLSDVRVFRNKSHLSLAWKFSQLHLCAKVSTRLKTREGWRTAVKTYIFFSTIWILLLRSKKHVFCERYIFF
jgi:hypothetical protein